MSSFVRNALAEKYFAEQVATAIGVDDEDDLPGMSVKDFSAVYGSTPIDLSISEKPDDGSYSIHYVRLDGRLLLDGLLSAVDAQMPDADAPAHQGIGKTAPSPP